MEKRRARKGSPFLFGGQISGLIRRLRSGVDLTLQQRSQFSSASTHGRGSGAGVLTEKFQYGFAQFRVLLGEIGEGLHGECFDDRAPVLEVGIEDAYRGLPFGGGELQARDHRREMPSKLFLNGLCKQPQQFGLVWMQKLRPLAGGFLRRIRGSHGDYGVRVPETSNEGVEFCRLANDERGHAICLSDGSEIAAGEQGAN